MVAARPRSLPLLRLIARPLSSSNLSPRTRWERLACCPPVRAAATRHASGLNWRLGMISPRLLQLERSPHAVLSPKETFTLNRIESQVIITTTYCRNTVLSHQSKPCFLFCCFFGTGRVISTRTVRFGHAVLLPMIDAILIRRFQKWPICFSINDSLSPKLALYCHFVNPMRSRRPYFHHQQPPAACEYGSRAQRGRR